MRAASADDTTAPTAKPGPASMQPGAEGVAPPPTVAGGPTTPGGPTAPAPPIPPTAPAPPPKPNPPVAPAPAPTRADEFPLQQTTLGPLHLGMTDAEAVKILKRPKAKPPKAELQGATGDYVSFWDFGQALLQMAAPDPKGPFKVVSIEITAPSKFKTPAGIGIGSTRGEVIAAYQDFLGQTDEPNAILVGSPYGGMLVRFQRDRAVSIFIGAMAF